MTKMLSQDDIKSMRTDTWDACIWAECVSNGWKPSEVLDTCKHMIGIPQKKPYIRHGKLFYRPWRNFFAGENAALEYLSMKGIGLTARMQEPGGGQYYMLTDAGLDWIGRQIGVIVLREGN